MNYKKAERTQSFVRAAFTGPTWGGKTYSALRMAVGLVIGGYHKEGIKDPTLEQIFDRILMIDTERERGRFYANRTDLPMETGQFYYHTITAPYHPDKYVTAAKEGAKIVGVNGVVIIDSLSHAWAYEGGILDINQSLAKQAGKNSYTAWNESGQIQNRMINEILTLPCHTISTIRSKMDYVLETNEKGKTAPRQVGLAPIQRDDVEYEFDITLMIHKDHKATIIKDTTILNQLADSDGSIGMLTEEIGIQLYNWLNSNTNIQDIVDVQKDKLIEEIQSLARKHTELKTLYKDKLFPDKPARKLTLQEAQWTMKEFSAILNKNVK